MVENPQNFEKIKKSEIHTGLIGASLLINSSTSIETRSQRGVQKQLLR